VESQWGGLDVLVHSVAYANREDLDGRFRDTSREGFSKALEVSAYSLVSLGDDLCMDVLDRTDVQTSGRLRRHEQGVRLRELARDDQLLLVPSRQC
jgi:hypothetical protein